MPHTAIYKRVIIPAHCPKEEYFKMLHEDSMLPYIYIHQLHISAYTTFMRTSQSCHMHYQNYIVTYSCK